MARASSRDAILLVFAEMVADRGYAETSIADVATALGLSKGTVVHHFGDKQSMLGELHAAYFTRRFAEVDHVLAELPDPVDRLVALMYLMLVAHRDDRAATLACLRELVRYLTGELHGYVHRQRERFTGVVVDTLVAGRTAGALTVDDPEMTALQIFGMCNYAWTWYRPDGRQTVEEITTVFASGLLRGLSSDATGPSDVGARVERAARVVRSAPGRLPAPAPAGPPA
ncbi:TetR/AcrR family transcriptional regulator [Pseudonocardia sp. HH130630-07]|uniref:TetR/AcrR family transcriptional regulator n=1 Tax=Pseudonocardia sp. HH130630-07 TaxID=1690815 RepID=UPI0008150869|nr:TetR/AcrR family transcriptional regulator [Pseudonocardia sp. HH130630-07]ANY07567.1 hypothetical protein AFB00_16125 [Pseudonocardia sp. HH130630-07]